MRYKKGDIVICVTNNMYGMKYLLEIGEQYEIEDFIQVSEKNIVNVNSLKTSENVVVFDDKHFMPLHVWREFQLRKVLD